jgi:hypothetical protein
MSTKIVPVKHAPDLNSNKKYGQSCRKPYNPCKNNAICKQVKVQQQQTPELATTTTDETNSASSSSRKIKLKIHCFCPNGFKGRFCDEDIDECAGETEHLLVNQQLSSKIKLITHDPTAAPCVPTAQCVNTIGSYVCNCNDTNNCYNTQSPQFQHLSSEANKRLNGHYKYSNYHYTREEDKENGDEDEIEIVNYDDEDVRDDNEIKKSNGDDAVDLTIHTLSSNGAIRQALYGLFGGISAILIVLSLGAGIACKVNMSQNSRRRKSEAMANTNGNNNNITNVNTSVDHDLFSVSSSTSTVNTKRPAPPSSKVNTRFTRMHKQRSSQTASLLSSTSGDECHFSKRYTF